MAETVKVVVRCRPMNSKERARSCTSIVKMDTDLGSVAISSAKAGAEAGGSYLEGDAAAAKAFTFDAVYDDNSTQKAVYQESAYPLVESVMQGFNGTIFAYGQTGCGKTHTMQGPPSDPGIIPQSFEHIFDNIKISSQAEYLVRASYIEIYNEQIRDLLGDDPRKKLELKEDPDKGVFVKGVRQVVVSDVGTMQRLMEQGFANRTVGSTDMNADSSRSHSIFTVIVEMNERAGDGSDHFRMGKLNLVDLAGSERQSKTGASGARLVEGCKINLSLSALGNVISALVDGKSKHIPYRDSKLTRLLQDSLGGNTKTVMCAAISPADYNYDETLSTLRYANRAKNIKNKPVVNEDPKDALLREYKDEITRLKQQLEETMRAMAMQPPAAAPPAAPRPAAAAISASGSVSPGDAAAAVSAQAEQLRAAPAPTSPAAPAPAAPAPAPAASEQAGVSAEAAAVESNDAAPDAAASSPPTPAALEAAAAEGGAALEAAADAARPAAAQSAAADADGGGAEESVEVLAASSDTAAREQAEEAETQSPQQQPSQQQPSQQQPSQQQQQSEAYEALLATQAEAERQRQLREQMERQLAALQHAVLGAQAAAAAEDAAAEEASVAAARQHAEHRRAQHKLRQQKKKEARLQKEKQRMVEERRTLEEEFKQAQEEAETNQRAMKALKRRAAQREQGLKQEVLDLQTEFEREREQLLEAIREQNKEVRLLEQLCALFFTPAEMSKVWERAKWNPDEETWVLPPVRPRKEYKPLTLPALGSASSAGSAGAVVTDDGMRPSALAPSGRRSVEAQGRSPSRDTEGSGEAGGRREKRKQKRKHKSAPRDGPAAPGGPAEDEAPVALAAAAEEEGLQPVLELPPDAALQRPETRKNGSRAISRHSRSRSRPPSGADPEPRTNASGWPRLSPCASPSEQEGAVTAPAGEAFAVDAAGSARVVDDPRASLASAPSRASAQRALAVPPLPPRAPEPRDARRDRGKSRHGMRADSARSEPHAASQPPVAASVSFESAGAVAAAGSVSDARRDGPIIIDGEASAKARAPTRSGRAARAKSRRDGRASPRMSSALADAAGDGGMLVLSSDVAPKVLSLPHKRQP